MLNLAENFDLGCMDRFSAACLHLIVESMRQAWTDRFVYVGGPDRMPVPLSGLVEKSYAAGLTAGLPTYRRPERTRPGHPWAHDPSGRRPATVPTGDPGGSDTTHLIAADGGGTVVTLTQTLGLALGSCFVPLGTGLNLYVMTMWMNPEPGTANSVGPGVRQVGHATPTLVVRDGHVVAALGAPCGRRVVSAMFQTIINMIDFSMDVQRAMTTPRLHCEGADPSAPNGPPSPTSGLTTACRRRRWPS